MNIVIKNSLTGNFYSNGSWSSNYRNAEVIEKGSPKHIAIRHTWDMYYTEELTPMADIETLADYLLDII